MPDVYIPDPIGGRERELEMLRRQTQHFIAQSPVGVVFRRGDVKVPDGSGGYTITPGAPMESQDFRLIPQGDGSAVRNVDGEEINPQYVLLGVWDADVRVEDVFQISNRNYEVTFVRLDRSYETWAEVEYRG